MSLRWFVFALMATFMAGCASTQQVQAPPDILYGARSPKGGVGIALAGGGSKAASYAMGVLAAVADSDSGFKGVDVISTVSGGGYSAFYLYSKMMLRGGDARPTDKELFEDCIPEAYRPFLPEKTPPICTNPAPEVYKFQQFVRCRQDVLENDCDQQSESGDRGEYLRTTVNSLGLGLVTLMMVPTNFVARTAFDWPVNLAPTRSAYLEGIGSAYGLYPLNTAASTKTVQLLTNCNSTDFRNCDSEPGYSRLDRETKNNRIGFDELEKFTSKKKGDVPIWVINATASPSRSLFGWATKGQRDFSKYTLQISPFAARSGFYHKVPKYREEMDILKAVTTSAAFFDANETASEQPWRMTFAALLHLFNLDWGIDIDNPNVHGSWRVLHSILPIGFYYADGVIRKLSKVDDNQKSGYIRLLDGGNNDNLGAYTLYEAGVKDIFIADHSYDGKGEMSDMCLLRNEVRLRSGGKKDLLIPGLEKFAQQCGSFIDESECAKGDSTCGDVVNVIRTMASKGRYPILEWKHNVLLGCIKSVDGSNRCDGSMDARIYLLKPAINLAKFKAQYLDGENVSRAACFDAPPGVCEVAAFMAKQNKDKGNIGNFPQDGTVAVTFASTGRIYGAYRELARWHMSEALNIKNSGRFSEELKRQADEPIERIQ